MLIVAIPKSSATSLVSTLGRLHDLPAKQIDMRPKAPPEEFQILSDIHRDQGEVSWKQAATLTSANTIYKQHVVPTANNRSVLRHSMKVVLLRDAADVVLAYRRSLLVGQDSDNGGLQRHFAGCRSESDWLGRAESIGLLRELEAFRQGWTDADGEQLVVQYNELVTQPRSVINRVEDYFGLPASPHVVLSKDRYTRGWYGSLRRFARQIPLLRGVVRMVKRSARPAV